MTEADVQSETTRAGDHLQLLRALAAELERAMHAIADNNLPELEDSVAAQQSLSERLSALANAFRAPAPHTAPVSGSLGAEIRAAQNQLQQLNLRYSILLEHSSRSVAMMASLLNSFRGQIQEAPGARPKHQTWSCRA
jgi:flagellar biosynthesis/type III secretory pathway chaperone